MTSVGRPPGGAGTSRARPRRREPRRGGRARRPPRPVVLGRQGRPGAVLGRGPARGRRVVGRRLPGLLGPEAARHPHDRRPGRAQDRVARGVRTRPCTRPGARRCCERPWRVSRQGWAIAVDSGHPEPAAGSAGILAVTVLTSDPEAGGGPRRRHAPRSPPGPAVSVSFAPPRTWPSWARRAPSLITVVPGIRLARIVTATTRPGWRGPFGSHPAPEPTSSSSAGPSRPHADPELAARAVSGPRCLAALAADPQPFSAPDGERAAPVARAAPSLTNVTSALRCN